LPSTSSSAPAEPGRHRGRLVAVAAAVVLVVAGVTVWAVTGSSSPRQARPAVLNPPPTVTPSSAPGAAPSGPPAPGFTAETLSGGHVTLSQLRGHPVLVNFWASWCHPCRQEFPLLAGAFAKYRARGLEIVGVSFEDIPSDARSFVAQEHADWTFARDDDGAIAAAYGVRPVPETFFVRRDGTLAGRLLEIPSARQLDASLQGIVGT
jgi:cytochrome c biogenesis protein CcmG, thiol:disulfide interchange protein DsbE